MHVMLSISESVWVNFHAECVRRKVFASKAVEALMVKQLEDFNNEEVEKKESHQGEI
jgi:hypothetical protein